MEDWEIAGRRYALRQEVRAVRCARVATEDGEREQELREIVKWMENELDRLTREG